MTIYNREDYRTVLPQLEKKIAGLLDFFYPVGTYYETSDVKFDPNKSLGGKWELVDELELVAWLTMHTSSTISASKNIASVTGTSARTITFTNKMANTDYIVTTSCEVSGAGSEITGVYSKTVNGFNVDFANYSGTATNPSDLSISVFGKLENPEKKKWHRIK